MKPTALIIALAIVAGFGGGYIVNDQTGERDRTVTVQHKRDSRPSCGLSLSGFNKPDC